jgi:CMP-N-acetylneuraminic acid synthetase
MYRLDPDQRMQPLLDQPTPVTRQALPSVYALNGAVYYAAAPFLRKERTFVTPATVAYVMPLERSIDIDTPFDWALAEVFLKQHA